MSQQPKWRLVANLGDVNPLDYGGYFVFVDRTNTYAPEGEILQEPIDDEKKYTIYRFELDRLKTVEDPATHAIYLVTERYAPDWPHAVGQYDEWFHKDLAGVASFIGLEVISLRGMFCSADPIERAQAYRAIGDYHGFANLDGYPLQLTRTEARRRYPRRWI